MKLRQVLILLVVAAFLGLFYWPTFRWLVQSWLSNPYYTHGFLVPLVSATLVWTKRGELKRGQTSAIGVMLLSLGAFVYVLGTVWAMRYVTALSLPIVLGALSVSFFGTKATRALLFPLCFLVFAIPLPCVEDMAVALQSVSVRSATWLLDAVGLTITALGPEIHLGDTTFTIGLPCSGMNTLIALLALVAVYAYLLSGPFSKRGTLLVIALPIAILANVLRIAALILAADGWGPDLALGLFHGILSAAFFILAFLCVALIGRLLGCRLGSVTSRSRQWN
jgi:exosortase